MHLPDGQPTPPDLPKSGGTSVANFRLFALAALTVALIGLCVVLAVPLLPALTWGAALAVIAWPLHTRLSRLLGKPALAAALSTAAVVVLIVGPCLFVVYQVAREAEAAHQHIQAGAAEGGLRDKAAAVPGLGGMVAWMDRLGLDLESETRKVIGKYTADVSDLLAGSVAAAVQFLVAVFVLYHLLRDRATFTAGVRWLLPLSQAETEGVFARAADSVHANLYATLVTSLIDGAGGGVMFWLLGLPAPLLWGVVMFVLSVLPVVGTGLVWVPAVAYLALAGRALPAAALVTWGVASWMVVDNVIYVRLAGERMRLHEVPALIAFLGGLAVFGVSGMILGPAILAVTVAVLEVWKRREKGAEVIAPAGAVSNRGQGAAG